MKFYLIKNKVTAIITIFTFIIRQYLNLRTFLAIVAIFIVSGTIIYSQYLARKIEKDEKTRVEQWFLAGKFISSPDSLPPDIGFATRIITDNKSIPIIETDENGRITQSVNLDSVKSLDKKYLEEKLAEFRAQHAPFEWQDPRDSTIRNRYYYGNSK